MMAAEKISVKVVPLPSAVTHQGGELHELPLSRTQPDHILSNHNTGIPTHSNNIVRRGNYYSELPNKPDLNNA